MFPLYYMHSDMLGMFKSYTTCKYVIVAKGLKCPEMQVITFHTWQAVKNTWCTDSTYSYLLYPPDQSDIERHLTDWATDILTDSILTDW